MYLLKHKLAQNVYVQLYSIFLFGSVILSQLLLVCRLKTEFHLLPVSETGTFNTPVLSFGG